MYTCDRRSGNLDKLNSKLGKILTAPIQPVNQQEKYQLWNDIQNSFINTEDQTTPITDNNHRNTPYGN